MNPFGNNQVNLSSSDIVKNKRSSVMYKSNQSNYSHNINSGRNRNVYFKSTGEIKNVKNYQTWQSLKTGHILCKSNGLCCDDISFNTIKINDENSNYTILDASDNETLILTYPSETDIDNVIIDPSNNLFASNECINPPLKITMKDDEKYKCHFKKTKQGYLRFLGDRNYKVNFIN